LIRMLNTSPNTYTSALARFMKAFGKGGCGMARERWLGRIQPAMKGNGTWARRVDLGGLHTQTVTHIRVPGSIIKQMARGHGPAHSGLSLENGRTTRSTDKAMKLSSGLVGTKALSFATVSRDSVFLVGKMDRGMRGFGKTISSTA
jgi:hypothetical protein